MFSKNKRSISSALFFVITGFVLQATAFAAESNAKVFIVSPKDGAVVSSPVKVVFGIKGMKVAPAGINKPNTGHHHLLIDAGPLASMTKPIPKDAHHMHFGKGQTETMLKLAPGKHTLQLVLGDYKHVPVGPALVSKKITIEVK